MCSSLRKVRFAMAASVCFLPNICLGQALAGQRLFVVTWYMTGKNASDLTARAICQHSSHCQPLLLLSFQALSLWLGWKQERDREKERMAQRQTEGDREEEKRERPRNRDRKTKERHWEAQAFLRHFVHRKFKLWMLLPPTESTRDALKQLWSWIDINLTHKYYLWALHILAFNQCGNLSSS